jgi:hypothetical protein
VNHAQEISSGYLPEWLRQRMGIRVGEGDDSNAAVVRQFGIVALDYLLVRS